MVLLPELYFHDPSLSNLNLLLTILSPHEIWENIFWPPFLQRTLIGFLYLLQKILFHIKYANKFLRDPVIIFSSVL